ncbi:MAG: autotransporter outer membrane beta-barrel domain-containing protein, partial [Cetobacterium sp.]|uniref:autotransporter outer membrane beta-barrel domain-containing protein n=1 Tax=Cetobacterium sp. TaxID=2071632 RepID=UPI003EE4E1DB
GNLEDIYDSIVKGDQLPNLAPTTDTENKTEEEARKGLLTLLDQIYANNPYVQAAKLSKENVGLFREQILSTKMPKENEWIAEGHGIYSIDEYGKTRDVKVGNTGISNNYSNKGVTTGLLGTGEYGVAQDTSLGFAVGGSHQKLDMSMNSKLKGGAIYLGVFGKKKVDNYLFTAGLGYQYGQYDGTRTIMNEYQSIRNTGEVKTDSFDIYGEVRYTFEDEKGRKIEPKLRLSQLFVNEKSVSEKDGALAIDMDKKKYSIPEVEIGVDFIGPIDVKAGKLESKFGIGVARTFGKNENYVTGRMKNSTDFKIMGPDFEDTKLRLSAGVDYEHVNGVFYNVNVGVDVAKDTKKEINAKIGIGYRF